jgi:hypothetical protein
LLRIVRGGTGAGAAIAKSTIKLGNLLASSLMTMPGQEAHPGKNKKSATMTKQIRLGVRHINWGAIIGSDTVYIPSKANICAGLWSRKTED